MESDYSLETVYEIWHDKHGSKIQVGPDRDSLGLIEIRSYTDDGTLASSITLERDQAQLVFMALGRTINDTPMKKETND